VLVAEDDGSALDSLRFSLADDIVELLVLTDDALFLQTLREAAGPTRRVWHVPSADKASDLLLAGQVGILVLDIPTLESEAARFIDQIKQQFPDLVMVAAGSREEETALAGLISLGIVYRFIHKPMSPGRARLFTDAAVKKLEDQRRRAASAPAAARSIAPHRGLLIAGIAAAVAIPAVIWALHGASRQDASAARPPLAETPRSADSPLLSQAAAALAANRLTDPSGNNALELYQRLLVRDPQDAAAKAGVAEVRERLLARAENALLEEHWDEAAANIETARRAGVEGGRLAFLSAQLAKSRDRAKTVLAQARAAKNDSKNAAPRVDDNAAALDLEQSLAMRLLAESRAAIDRRDFETASARIAAADGIAAPANIQGVQQLLEAARRQAESESVAQLLKNAHARLSQDQLIQPENDNAKYYLLALRSIDPANSGLAAALQDFGVQVTAKARRALMLEQFDAARSWLDEAAAVGYSSADSQSVLNDLDSALAKQKFLSNAVSASELTLLKSVQPKYPEKAELDRLQGWVELDFTVAESGEVKDVAVHGASAPGRFDQAAIAALSQWRYRPVMRDGKPVPQRARIRIRFNLAA
jgi:TonB family protein